MPLPLTVSRFSKIQIGFSFLVPAHQGSPEQRGVKRVCVYLHSALKSSNGMQRRFGHRLTEMVALWFHASLPPLQTASRSVQSFLQDTRSRGGQTDKHRDGRTTPDNWARCIRRHTDAVPDRELTEIRTGTHPCRELRKQSEQGVAPRAARRYAPHPP